MTDPAEKIVSYRISPVSDFIPYKGMYACIPAEDYLIHKLSERNVNANVMIFGKEMYEFLTSEGRYWSCITGWTKVEKELDLGTEGTDVTISDAAVYDPDSLSGSEGS